MKYLISLDILIFTLELIGKLVGVLTYSWFIVCMPILIPISSLIGVYVGLATSAKLIK